jgi:hypothetical protein
MKKFICISLVAILACSVLSIAAQGKKKPSKTEKREMLATKVKDSIDHKTFTINVNMAYPMSHAAINLTSNYSLRLAGDSLISYLPYYGRAFRVPYGGGKALNFSAKIKDCTISYPKKNRTRIHITVSNDEDTYQYDIDVFDNASTTISVISNEREFISFSGTLDTK